MIQEAKETDRSYVRKQVDFSLVALVEHYRQPIHQAVKEESSAPYFDELLGQPPTVPALIQHWVDQLLDGRHSGAVVVQSLVEGYVKHVRPHALRSDRKGEKYHVSLQGNEVLKYYELLLSQFCEEASVEMSETTVTVITNEFQEAMHALSSDVTMLTASRQEKDEKTATNVLRNDTLPTMIRVLSHAVCIFERTAAAAHHRESLARVATTLLAFGTPRLTPLHVLSNLSENEIMNKFAYPPTTFEHDMNHLIQKDYWSKMELSGAAWDDPVSGIATRAAVGCWKAINRCLEDTHSKTTTDQTDDDDVKKCVCLRIGMDTMARAIRAHVFVRDAFRQPQKAEKLLAVPKKPPTNFPLGTKKPELNVDQPFDQVPSRIHSALNFIALLESLHVSCQVLEDVLPICYAFLDSAKSVHVTLGATALLRLFENAPSLSEFGDGIVSVLELACRTCRDGPPLTVICMARSLCFEKVSTRQKERRQATAELLDILQKNSYRDMDTEDGLILGLLVGGIVPLLYQHAKEKNADSLEMGRLGLECLLPLLRWDYNAHGRRVQLASLVALVNLLMGAYPIMPLHGGKIMSTVLSCMGHAHRDLEQETLDKEEKQLCRAVVDLSRHCAAVAVVLCGERATSVLDHVEQDESYDRIIVNDGQEIRALASAVLQREKKNERPVGAHVESNS